MSNCKRPSSAIAPPTEPLWPAVPSPSTRAAPAAMVVEPVKVLAPVRVSVPAEMVRAPPWPPSPITPEKVPPAAVRVRVLEPRSTTPIPDSDLIKAPDVVWEMSKVPPSFTFEESVMEPPPDSASVAPGSMVVAPP